MGPVTRGNLKESWTQNFDNPVLSTNINQSLIKYIYLSLWILDGAAPLFGI